MVSPTKRRYLARRSLLIEQGRWQPAVLTDAGPARDWVRHLMAAKVSARQIAARSGVRDCTIYRLLYGRTENGVRFPPTASLRPEVAAAILAVTPDPDKVIGGGRVSPVASARRLQALTWRGWPVATLAARIPINRNELRRIRAGDRTHLLAGTSRAINAVYEELWDQDPPQDTKRAIAAVAYAREEAARQGWVPPGAWDDDTIGDPAARPAPMTERRRTSAELAAEAAFLMSWGATQESAAAQLLVPLDTLQQATRRAARAAS